MAKNDEIAALHQEIDRLNAEVSRLRAAQEEQEFARHATLLLLEDLETQTRNVERIKREWASAFDAVTDPIFIHDQEFRIVRANRAYAELAGLDFRAFIGRLYWEVFPRRDGPFPNCARSLQADGELDVKGEEEITLDSGEVFASRASAIRDETGAYVHSIHILHNITERKRAARALAENEEMFRAITSTAQDAIILMDNDGNIAYWNEAATRIFGYQPEEVLGKPLHQLLAPARFHDAYGKGFAHFRASGEGRLVGQLLELAALRKDGSEFPMELSVSAVQLHGKWYGAGLLRDISDRKEAEQRIADSEATFRTIFDSASDGILLADVEEGRFLSGNARICAMLGYSSEELMQLNVEQIHPAEAMPYIREQFGRQARGEITLAEDMPVQRRDGSVFYAEINSSPLMLHGKRYLLGLFRDITARKQAEDALKHLNRALRTISRGNEVLIRARSEDELLANACQVMVTEGGYRMAWIGYALPDRRKSVQVVSQAGDDSGYLAGVDLSWAEDGDHGPTGTAIRSGTPSMLRDVRVDADKEPWRRETVALGMTSIIALPLRFGEKILGAITIYASDADAFDDAEVRLLTELADDLAYGIVSLRSSKQLRRTLVDTIQAIALTVEKRDPYTAGHQRRVAELAVAIAEQMGLDSERIEGLRLGGIIHDIGKIYVPAEILNRPGRLSPLEFAMIKSHPQVGFDIIKDVDFPWPVADIILQHHERLDGSGYPHGLTGDAIGLEARILAVADVVEAIMSHRPYRPALGIEFALDEIDKNKGILYDPDAVEACLQLFHDNSFAWE